MKLKIIILLVCSLVLNSCFSAKGLPVKTVKKTETNQPKSTNKEQDNTTTSTTQEKPKETKTTDLDHSKWNNLLNKHVQENGDVDYKGFKKDNEILNAYVAYLAGQIPEKSWSVEKQLAYFINVYNANTIKLIVDNYPVKSIKDISNPWLKNRIKIGEEDYSLADIENGILRKMNEPRIHFAINCASIGCPKLLNEAYTSKNVMDLMEKATKEFINNTSKNSIKENQIKISEIFKWYKSDFTKNGSIIDYINTYSNIKINTNTEVNYKDYNWNLNDI